jgi:hypothetical protein
LTGLDQSPVVVTALLRADEVPELYFLQRSN